MKKPIAFVLSAALLTLPVAPAVAFGDTLSETNTVSTTENVTQDDSTTSSETEEVTTEEESTVDGDGITNEEGNVVDADGNVVDPGTLPDSPLYWLDELMEKLQVALAFSPEKKVKLMEKQACERLAEALAIAQKVSDEETTTDTSADLTDATENTENVEDANSESADNVDGADVTDEEAATSDDTEDEATDTQPTNLKIEKKIRAFEKALKGYDAKIAHAQEFLAEIEDPESETAQKLQEALTKVNANNVVVLGSLLEKLPPQAAQRVAVNIVRSMEKAVEKMEKMEAKNKKIDQENEQSDDEVLEEVAQDTDVDIETENDTDENAATSSESIDTSKVKENTVVQMNNLGKYADKGELTKDEYKELKKEAHEALKEFQEDLGLKGPHKNEKSDSEDSRESKETRELKESKVWEKVDEKKVDRDRDDNRGKSNDNGDRSKKNGKDD